VNEFANLFDFPIRSVNIIPNALHEFGVTWLFLKPREEIINRACEFWRPFR